MKGILKIGLFFNKKLNHCLHCILFENYFKIKKKNKENLNYNGFSNAVVFPIK